MVNSYDVDHAKMQAQVDNFRIESDMKRAEVDAIRARIDLMKAFSEALRSGKVTTVCCDVMERYGVSCMQYPSRDKCLYKET
jgi:hypothetical protein